MATLTSQQATELANCFLGLAQAINDFHYNNWHTLTEEEKLRLAELETSILKCGEDILALSTTLVMDDILTSLESINTITSQIKGTIQQLQNIQKGINVAASIAKLGAAIVNKNPQIIIEAINGVYKTWNS